MLCLVVRPPLVYGPGVKGNMLKLLRIAEAKIPLPFAFQLQKRSVISVRNLASSLLYLALVDQDTINQKIFLVSDDDPISVTKVINTVRSAQSRSSGQFWFPEKLTRIFLSALGKDKMASKLLDDLVVDDREIRKLGWTPPYTLDDEFEGMLASYLKYNRLRIVNCLVSNESDFF